MSNEGIGFVAGEDLAGTQYTIVHPDGRAEPAGTAESIARGGAGVVYRAVHKRLMHRALKCLSPREELRAKVDSEQFRATFLNEIQILARITHTRLSKITDFGEVSVEGQQHPYYAMDLIEGSWLDDDVWGSERMTGLVFHDVVDQILDGVAYLHAKAIMHCDLKPKNLLVKPRAGAGFEVTIVDLGVAKVINPEAATDEAEPSPPPSGELEASNGDGNGLDDDTTFFFSTKSITRPEWHNRLENVPIPRAWLLEMFPSHDLYGIGKLVDSALSNDGLRDRLEHDLGSAGVRALRTVRDRLLCRAGEEYYQSAEQLRQDWEKLHPRYLAPLNIPELAIGANARTSVATPSGRVSLTDRVSGVINHPVFQRLRNVPQLELASLVYPGATHTRLLHSLSTFDTARRYIAHLLNDPFFRLLVEPVEIEAILFMALLHDVGHYPLSHMFEDFAATEVLAVGSKTGLPNDDDLFWSFLDPESTAAQPFGDYGEVISEALLESCGRGIPSFHDHLCQRQHLRVETLDAMHRISKPTEASGFVLSGVLSSDIDVDKVAYLLDDSRMSGVRYGLGIDLDALLASLRAPHADHIHGAPLIAIADKGLPAAESIILARYWMIKRVYWHHTNRAITAMVKYVIRSLLDAERMDMPTYIGKTMFRDHHYALRYLLDEFDSAAAAGALASDARNPIEGIVDANRGVYKRVATISRGIDERLYTALAYQRWDELETSVAAVRSVLQSELGHREIRPGDIIIDVPAKPREVPDAPVMVYMKRAPDTPQVIDEVSPVVEARRDEFDAHVKKCRVFVHPSLIERLDRVELDALQARVRSALAEACRVG